MFLHNFKYISKVLLRNRMLLFWTYAFPILLGTFFKMAFSNIESNEAFDVVPVAIVKNEAFLENKVLQETFLRLGDTNSEEQMFDITYTTQKEAQKMMEDDKICGYLIMEDEKPQIVVMENGIDQTIFKSVTEEIIQAADLGGKMSEKEQVILHDTSRSNLSYTMIEFYTLIAMSCLYGGIIGMSALNYNLADQSSNGRRITVGPSGRGIMVLSSAAAGYVIQLVGIGLLFLYTAGVLEVDYGNKFGYIIILALAGSLAGLTLGMAVAALFRANENAKTGILIGVTMLGCFLSGMMGITMKYVIDKNFALVNRINPAAMITDGLYSLYYYDTWGRFWRDVAGLLIFSGVMLVLSFQRLRRVRYDSI